MKRLIIAALMVAPSLALAQQPSPQEFTLKLSASELDIVGKALEEIPFKTAAPLMQKLRQQIMEQQTPPKPVAAPVPVPKKE